MHQKIRRSTCAAVCRWWEQNGAPRVMNQPVPQQGPVNPGAVFFGVNKPQQGQTKTVILPGDPLATVSFYPATISYAVALRRVLNNKLKLQVRPLLDSELPSRNGPVAITGAAPNHITQIKWSSGNVFFAHVYTPFSYDPNDALHEHPLATNLAYLKRDFTATDDQSAAFADIGLYSGHGPSDAGGFWAVCACQTFEGQGGGGQMSGDDILNELNVAKASTVTSVTSNSETMSIPTAGSATFTLSGNASVALSDTVPSGSSVQVVTDIAAVNGALGVEKKYLSSSLSGSQQTANVALTTTSKTLVTSVTALSANRVTDITARS